MASRIPRFWLAISWSVFLIATTSGLTFLNQRLDDKAQQCRFAEIKLHTFAVNNLVYQGIIASLMARTDNMTIMDQLAHLNDPEHDHQNYLRLKQNAAKLGQDTQQELDRLGEEADELIRVNDALRGECERNDRLLWWMTIGLAVASFIAAVSAAFAAYAYLKQRTPAG